MKRVLNRFKSGFGFLGLLFLIFSGFLGTMAGLAFLIGNSYWTGIPTVIILLLFAFYMVGEDDGSVF